MKSVKLSHDNYFDIEQIIRRVAEENNIKDISKINIKLSKEEGFVKFAIVDDWAEYDEEGDEILHTQGVEEDEEVVLTPKHGPYEFRITYQTVTPESAEIGDYEDQGWELQDGYAEDIDDLIHQLEDYGFYEDVGHSLDELRFNTVDPVHDRAYFEDGESKYYTVFITRDDGGDFEQTETSEIKSRLGIRQ